MVIAAGVDPDRELLSSLVAGEEPLRAVGALAASSAPLADIFRREISANRTRQGPSLRVLPAADLLDPSAASAPGAEILRAQRPDLAASWPAIQRYARAKVAPHAAAIWNSERGEPLLAIHRVGLGAIAACAFAPTEGWGAGWAGRQDLWGPILRALARGKPDVSPCVRIAGDELTVEDLPLDAPPELEARVFAADAQAGAAPTAVLRLSPASTGGDPRRTRSARWPSEMRDALESADAAQFPRVELHARGPHATWSPLVLPLAIPHAPEFVLPRPRFRADDGAARPLAAAHPQRAVRAHPAAPEVLFSGLFLLTFAGLAGFFARRAR